MELYAIDAEVCLASYMTLSDQDLVTVNEVSNWVDYFEKHFNNSKRKCITKWSHEYLKDLKYTYDGTLYNIDLRHGQIMLRDSRSIDEVAKSFSKAPVEIILKMFDIYQQYQEEKVHKLMEKSN